MNLSAYRMAFAVASASRAGSAVAIGALAKRALILELETYPKPGLVSSWDCGSHADMNAATLHHGIEAIAPYLAALAEAGYEKREMPYLRKLGLAAERDMFAATHGINTHRGAIFGLGLLCAAAGAQTGDPSLRHLSLGEIVTYLWSRDILQGPVLTDSHGQMARARYGAGGAQQEAASGFPSVYNAALPALSLEIDDDDVEALRVQACFVLIATVDDTNLLHRGGREGLSFAQAAARSFLKKGGIRTPFWRHHALAVHDHFIERRLSPGGSADLLACALFVHMYEQAGFWSHP